MPFFFRLIHHTFASILPFLLFFLYTCGFPRILSFQTLLFIHSSQTLHCCRPKQSLMHAPFLHCSFYSPFFCFYICFRSVCLPASLFCAACLPPSIHVKKVRHSDPLFLVLTDAQLLRLKIRIFF